MAADLQRAGRSSVHRHAIAAAGVLSAIAALAAARDAWPAVLYTLLSDGLLALAWMAAMVGIGSLLLPRRWLRGDDAPTGPLVAATWAGAGIGVTSLLILGLGAAGALSGILAWAMLVIGWGALLARAIANRAALNARFQVSGATWLWLLAGPAIGVLLVGPSVLPGVLWGDEPHGYDVLSYHLQVPRDWYQTDRIRTLDHNVFSFFPLAMEAHYLLAMHLRGGPWAGMYLAQYMHAATAAMIAVAVYGTLRPRGRGGATAGAVIALATPWTAMVGVVAYNEAGLMLFAALAVAWALRTEAVRSRQDARPAYASAVVAGAMAGFGYAVKMTAAAMIIAPLAVVMFLASAVIWRRFYLAAVFLVSAVVTSSPWWGRNLVLTGNPVFPEMTNVLPAGRFSATQVERWKAAHSPRLDQRSIAPRASALADQVLAQWRYGLAVLPAAVVAWLIAPRDRLRRLLLFVIVVQVSIWLFATHLQGRFLITSIPVAAMLIGSLPFDRLRAMVPIGAAAMAAACSLVLVARLASVTPDAYGVREPERLWELHPPQIVRAVREGERPIALAGDAMAFFWPVEASRLTYRTVFDVDARPDETLIDAWIRGAPPDAIIIVHPSELRRLSQSYRGLGEPPAEVAGRTEPFILER